MSLLSTFMKRIKGISQWFLKASLVIKIIIVVVIVGIGWFTVTRLKATNSQKVQYQTSAVEKGTLIVSITASGQVSTANASPITTNASGVIKKLYTKDGETVKAGDPIADIDLDLQGKQKYSQASSSYQSAQNSLAAAQASVNSSQASLFTQWKQYYNLATNSYYTNGDGSPNETNRQLADFYISKDNWLTAEAQYKNQLNAVTQAQMAVSASWYSYQQASPTVYAPISGTVSGLSLQVGTVISPQSSNSNGTVNSTSIANVITQANPIVSLNLTEIDVPKITLGNKATITFDAIPDKTFTGKVVSIDRVGVLSSGVTNYPTVIQLDTTSPNILPNMAATASIITDTKDNVLLVPTSAVQTQTGTGSYVRVLQNGQPVQISVTTGASSDTQIEIVAGVTEGTPVVTAVTGGSTTRTTTTTTSPFGISGFGGARTGGAVRVRD
jgi:multidrug efflux pump subunit AcrA (membrane-fusion protein)